MLSYCPSLNLLPLYLPSRPRHYTTYQLSWVITAFLTTASLMSLLSARPLPQACCLSLLPTPPRPVGSAPCLWSGSNDKTTPPMLDGARRKPWSQGKALGLDGADPVPACIKQVFEELGWWSSLKLTGPLPPWAAQSVQLFTGGLS